jgi:hypothetical protein
MAQTDEVSLLKNQLRRVEMEQDIFKSVDSTSPIELRRQHRGPFLVFERLPEPSLLLLLVLIEVLFKI